MKILFAILAFFLALISTPYAETVTLVATAPDGGGTGFSQTLTIPTNRLATLLRVHMPLDADPPGGFRVPRVEVTVGTNTYVTEGNTAVSVAGPASIRLAMSDGASSYCTFRVTDEQPQFSPSTAVVIPSDATGPVRIILESSPDLLNWSDALPGTYGSSTTNRFFRVRALKL